MPWQKALKLSKAQKAEKQDIAEKDNDHRKKTEDVYRYGIIRFMKESTKQWLSARCQFKKYLDLQTDPPTAHIYNPAERDGAMIGIESGANIAMCRVCPAQTYVDISLPDRFSCVPEIDEEENSVTLNLIESDWDM